MFCSLLLFEWDVPEANHAVYVLSQGGIFLAVRLSWRCTPTTLTCCCERAIASAWQGGKRFSWLPRDICFVQQQPVCSTAASITSSC